MLSECNRYGVPVEAQSLALEVTTVSSDWKDQVDQEYSVSSKKISENDRRERDSGEFPTLVIMGGLCSALDIPTEQSHAS